MASQIQTNGGTLVPCLANHRLEFGIFEQGEIPILALIPGKMNHMSGRNRRIGVGSQVNNNNFFKVFEHVFPPKGGSGARAQRIVDVRQNLDG
jgi:hypothetical protein